MQIQLISGGYLPKGLTTFYVVEDYDNHHTVYGRFTTHAEAAACVIAHYGKTYKGRDAVVREMHMTGGR